MFLDVLLDTLIDSLKMLPFLLVAYFLIELLERKGSNKLESFIYKAGDKGFIPAAFLGILPQCGFSAMIANLYTSHVITIGTLIAVFISTSDEALPIFLSYPEKWLQLIILLVLKVLFALFYGFIFDIALKNLLPAKVRGGFSGNIEEVDCQDDHNEEESLLVATIRHTANIFIYIFIIEFLISASMEYFGADKIAESFEALGSAQIFIASIVGMIPNCASSVLLTQMYMDGNIAFPVLFAGLCSGSGVGTLILIKTEKSKKHLLLILSIIYLLGVFSGLILSLFGVAP